MSQQGGINIGEIYAELDIRSDKLDQGLAKGRKALDAISKEIDQLDRDFAEGAITVADYSARMAALGTTATELASRMQAAYAATHTLDTGLEILNQQANRMTASSARMGMALMQLGYIADDVQYGFAGVVNNIGPLIAGLGGGPGVAAAAQLAAVGIYQLYVHWDQFQELIGNGSLKTEAEEMEELAKATKRTADEQERLNKFKEEQNEIQRMMAGKSKAERDTDAAVQEILQEAGQENIQAGLEKTIGVKPERQAEIDRLKAEIAHNQDVLSGKAKGDSKGLNPMGGILDRGNALAKDAELRSKLAKSEERAVKERELEAQRLMKDAKRADAKGQEARDKIMKVFGDPNHPLYSVAMQLGSASPEALANAEKEGALGKARAEEAREQEKERERKEKEAEREAKRKAQAAEADRKKELGPLGYLLEKRSKGTVTPGEEAEIKRLQAEKVERANKEREQEQKANVRESMEAPGMKSVTKSIAMQVVGGAMTAEMAKIQIADYLAANGRTETQAQDASGEILDEAKKDVENSLVDSMFKGRDEDADKQKTSQVFDASALAANFQASVGGSEEKKQTGILEEMQKHLEKMAQAGGIVIGITS